MDSVHEDGLLHVSGELPLIFHRGGVLKKPLSLRLLPLLLRAHITICHLVFRRSKERHRGSVRQNIGPNLEHHRGELTGACDDTCWAPEHNGGNAIFHPFDMPYDRQRPFTETLFSGDAARTDKVSDKAWIFSSWEHQLQRPHYVLLGGAEESLKASLWFSYLTGDTRFTNNKLTRNMTHLSSLYQLPWSTASLKTNK